MKVEVVMAVAGQVQCQAIELAAGASVADALASAGIAVPENGAVGVFGRVRALDERLTDGERVEVYLPLKADPKQARRIRARRRS
ncbi:RnfH family protein [Nevskia sp.]|uniref:RnfH family protein n=1 Tax=Nevskia sp. TaxID=1929292 RepID=UPI0025D1B311|nr:RnfH family protein [Nevskia sp.]